MAGFFWFVMVLSFFRLVYVRPGYWGLLVSPVVPSTRFRQQLGVVVTRGYR